MKLATLFGVIAFAWGTANSFAETKWPSFQAGLTPGPDNSPQKAKLPDDVVIRPPGSNVPAAAAAFSGVWAGWMCRNRACSTRLAVEEVTATDATIVYAFASGRVSPAAVRLKATFQGFELIGMLPSGGRITYRMRSDGNLDVMYNSANGRNWASGILSRSTARRGSGAGSGSKTAVAPGIGPFRDRLARTYEYAGRWNHLSAGTSGPVSIKFHKMGEGLNATFQTSNPYGKYVPPLKIPVRLSIERGVRMIRFEAFGSWELRLRKDGILYGYQQRRSGPIRAILRPK